MAGISERLIDLTSAYLKAETVINGTKTGSYIRTGAGGQIGATKILFRVNGSISLADTKTLTLAVRDATSSAGAGVATIGTITLTAAGATVYSSGAALWEFVLPRTVREYTTVTVGSNDTGVAGSVDAFCSSPVGFKNV